MHSPERICEALAWLYGVEFKARQGLKMLGFHTEYMPSSDIFSNQRVTFLHRNDETFCACWPYNRREDITDRVAHALEVTAPWEWDDGGEDVVFAFRGDDVMGHVQDNKAQGASWRVSTDDGVTHSDSTLGVETAKSDARTSYLTYMRGHLALRGLEK